jgi:phage shock protein A
MGLKRRIGFIVKSQFNDWVTRAEDPEKILNQAVEEMEEGLETAKAKISLLRYRVEEENNLLTKLGEQVEYWQKKAEEYVAKAMNTNAREAVRKRRVLENEHRLVSINFAQDKIKFDEYEERYSELDKRIRASKSRRGLLLKEISINKGPSGGIQSSPSDALTHADDPFSVFNKMEERVEKTRKFSAASKEREETSLENERKLIDEEIDIIKKTLGKGGSKR